MQAYRQARGLHYRIAGVNLCRISRCLRNGPGLGSLLPSRKNSHIMLWGCSMLQAERLSGKFQVDTKKEQCKLICNRHSKPRSSSKEVVPKAYLSQAGQSRVKQESREATHQSL